MLDTVGIQQLSREALVRGEELRIARSHISGFLSDGRISFEEYERLDALFDEDHKKIDKIYRTAHKALTYHLDQVRPRIPFMPPAPAPTEEEERFLEASWSKIFSI